MALQARTWDHVFSTNVPAVACMPYWMPDLVLHVHQLEDGRAVVGDGDVAIGRLEHLVHALGPQRGAEHARDGLGSADVGLDSVDAADAGLAVLFLNGFLFL